MTCFDLVGNVLTVYFTASTGWCPSAFCVSLAVPMRMVALRTDHDCTGGASQLPDLSQPKGESSARIYESHLEIRK